eukprot:1268425-Rhodomonas_salina.2
MVVVGAAVVAAALLVAREGDDVVWSATTAPTVRGICTLATVLNYRCDNKPLISAFRWCPCCSGFPFPVPHHTECALHYTALFARQFGKKIAPSEERGSHDTGNRARSMLVQREGRLVE